MYVTLTVSSDPLYVYQTIHVCLPNRLLYTKRLLCTGSMAEWLALVTLAHVPQRTRTGGSRFEPWFGLGSSWWILDEFSPTVYPMVSHLLVH